MTHYETPTDWKSEVWWRKRRVEERLFHMHLTPRILDYGISTTPPTSKYFSDWQPGDSLLITGPTRTGKSITAAHLMHHLISAYEASGRWIQADDYVGLIKESFDNHGLLPEMYSTPHLLKYLKSTFDIVVVDSLGDETLTDFAAHELGSLIRKRHDQMKSTIVTTRLSMVDIVARYGDRLASALSEFSQENTRAR